MSYPKFPLRNRIQSHREIRASDLVPHPLNWRAHPDHQKDALLALYAEIGFARSLLAYELPDGRLQLIDGHLRRDLTPDEIVTVEVVDLNEEEARKLMLSIDPLASLATADDVALKELRAITETDSDALRSLWDSLGSEPDELSEPSKDDEPEIEEQYLILVTCESEDEQAELLRQFQREGIRSKPLSSC